MQSMNTLRSASMSLPRIASRKYDKSEKKGQVDKAPARPRPPETILGSLGAPRLTVFATIAPVPSASKPVAARCAVRVGKDVIGRVRAHTNARACERKNG